MGMINTGLIRSVIVVLACPALTLVPRMGLSALEEVVVTTRRRQENLQDVPIAVSGAVGIAAATFIGGEIFDAIGKTAPFLMMVVFNLVIISWAIYLHFTQETSAA
jgi:predicted MFS family arabinose efflux permease